MKHQVETTVLRGIDRTLEEEEWPLLELKDATITHHHRRKKAGQLVDLFEVNLHGPFRVKGRLGKLKKHQESLVLGTASKLYKEDIVIPEAYTYSLEIKDDGRIIIWVLGNCGWYALSPSKEYKAIFDQMVEKTKIWLFLEAKYVPAIYKGKYRLRGSAHDVFVEFSREYPDWPTAKEAAALFHKHHEWIVLKMLVKAEEVDNWARTPIHTEMFTQHKDTVSEIQRLLRARSEQGMSTAQDADANQLASIQDEEHVIRVKSESKVISEASTELPSQSTTPIMISNPITQRQNLRLYTRSQKVVPPSPPAALKREPSLPIEDTTEDAEEEESSESEPEDVKPIRRSAKGKSVLRPRTSTIPLEAPTPLASCSPTTKFDEDDEMMDFKLEEDTKPSNKRPALSDDNDPLATPAERLKKRYRAIHAQPRRSQSRSETPSIDTKLEWPALRPGTGKSPIEMGYMPPTSSCRPGGPWMCSVPNCKYKLLEGDSVAGRALIEAHYESHARVMQDAMEIIGVETQAARGIYHVE
ncbi:hypothetical protein L211DRAFT_847623 [Terfezia boudieri ATCC MYA-4762]|uniref:RFTS domain-containing protein n=1 Tax=Terfezia boudieri ATCC MYA-4762 TaxID=1051890 RepID=A0A3N4LSI5_9PEZI|nr:hypothetical protein L211DRAFT_847623 [Terfezia boudieri ATCC MYA-4762]